MCLSAEGQPIAQCSCKDIALLFPVFHLLPWHISLQLFCPSPLRNRAQFQGLSYLSHRGSSHSWATHASRFLYIRRWQPALGWARWLAPMEVLYLQPGGDLWPQTSWCRCSTHCSQLSGPRGCCQGICFSLKCTKQQVASAASALRGCSVGWVKGVHREVWSRAGEHPKAGDFVRCSSNIFSMPGGSQICSGHSYSEWFCQVCLGFILQRSMRSLQKTVWS